MVANKETITLEEVWQWAGGDPSIKPTREALKNIIDLMNAITHEAEDSNNQSTSDSLSVLIELRDRVLPNALRYHAAGIGDVEEAIEMINVAINKQTVFVDINEINNIIGEMKVAGDVMTEQQVMNLLPEWSDALAAAIRHE